jgi:hypothetical protein
MTEYEKAILAKQEKEWEETSERWEQESKDHCAEMQKLAEKWQEEYRIDTEIQEQQRQYENRQRGTLKDDDIYGWGDHPNTMENGTATFLWIVVMIISILFKGGWVLCILETIIWWKFITRHN